jgi:hypothetical protein
MVSNVRAGSDALSILSGRNDVLKNPLSFAGRDIITEK